MLYHSNTRLNELYCIFHERVIGHLRNQMPKVIIYTVPGCPRCKQVFRYMEERGIAYQEIDVIADNKKFAKEMIVKSGQKSVPVTEIDGKIIVGYQPDVFASILQK